MEWTEERITLGLLNCTGGVDEWIDPDLWAGFFQDIRGLREIRSHTRISRDFFGKSDPFSENDIGILGFGLFEVGIGISRIQDSGSGNMPGVNGEVADWDTIWKEKQKMLPETTCLQLTPDLLWVRPSRSPLRRIFSSPRKKTPIS